MRRFARWSALLLAALLGLAAMLLAVALLGANTAIGREALVWLIPRLTSGEVRVRGIAGHLPGAPRVRRLTLADASGPYLTARGVALDWRPLRLLRGAIAIDRLAAAEVRVLRIPGGSGSAPGQSMPVAVRAFSISRLDLVPAIAGKEARLAVHGAFAEDADGTTAITVAAHRLGEPGSYHVEARFDPRTVSVKARFGEPAGGLLARLAGLPDLGPIRLTASLAGPRDRIATDLVLGAGALIAHAHGEIDLTHRSADLAVDATAPAMRPRADIAWRRIAFHARLAGKFAAPRLAGQLDIASLMAAGGEIGRIAATVSGTRGAARLHATLSGILLPMSGPGRALLAAAPLTVTAGLDFAARGRPLSLRFAHPLIAGRITGTTEGQRNLAATIRLPDLSPIAAIAGVALTGSGHLAATISERPAGLALDLAGGLGVTGGAAPLVPLLGAAPRFALAARQAVGGGIAISRFSLSGAAVSFGLAGTAGSDAVALEWNAAVSDLAAFGKGLAGTLDAKGRVEGRTDALVASAAIAGMLGGADFAPAPVRARLALHGLPGRPEGTLSAHGTLAGAPLRLDLAASRRDGGVRVAIHAARWKSAHANGAIVLRGDQIGGRIAFAIADLGDFSGLIGTPLGGAVSGALVATAPDGPPGLALDLTGTDLVGAGASVRRARVTARMRDPFGDRRIAADLALAGIAAGRLAGAEANLSATGPIDALDVRLAASAPGFDRARLAARARLDAGASRVELSTLTAAWHGVTVRLLGPARIGYAPGLSVVRLRLGMQGAELTADGRIRPALGLTLRLSNVTPTLIDPFVPGLPARGRLDATATLSGTLAAPTGRLTLRGRGLGLAATRAAGLPPAALTATADLAGGRARIETTLSAGRATRLTLSGTVPLTPTGTLALAAKGGVDLAIVDPILIAEGRRIEGRLTLDARLGGTIAHPAIAGTARLARAMFADYATGIDIRDIAGTVAATGDTIRIDRLQGRAGPGTIAVSGNVGVFAPDLPVNLTIAARDAELPRSDLMTARFDSDLAIHGSAHGRLSAGGTVRFRRVEINIPESMPPSLARLRVVRAGASPPPRAMLRPNVALALTVSAAREIFVRGRGIDAEFAGRIHIGGTAANPVATGGFRMVRGAINMAGKTLVFTEGRIGFNGGSPENPTLHLVATNVTGSTTATLTIGGTVEKPTVALSSAPVLPQDQVLGALFFNGSTALSPFQLAELASSLATLTGAGPGTGDPLGALRNGLGLDQLSVGASASGSPTLQAGRYIGSRFYVGATQSATGGRQADVEVNLTKRLRLNATIGTGIANASGASRNSGPSIGLKYQFHY